jgi:uncharacterized protein (DUF433 family)
MSRTRITAAQLARFTNPREMPAYSIRDAAHYLQLPSATLRTWVLGRPYPTQAGTQWFAPLIALPEPELKLLSFTNLAEAHVLSAIRRARKLDLQVIRNSLDFVKRRFNWERPLTQQRFATDGVRLFVEHLGTLIDVSSGGQMLLGRVEDYVDRFDWLEGSVVRFWPFTRKPFQESPKAVLIDPSISFGRPSLDRVFVPTAEIAGRYKAGDSIELLADDYGCSKSEIEEGLRCELEYRAAA